MSHSNVPRYKSSTTEESLCSSCREAWTGNDRLDYTFTILALSSMCSLKRDHSFIECIPVGDQGLEIAPTPRNKGDGNGVITSPITEQTLVVYFVMS